MDQNIYSGGAFDFQHQLNDEPSQRDDQRHGMFEWMSTHSGFPPESLPRAPEPVVYEGFIPDAYSGLMLPSIAPPDDVLPYTASRSFPVLHRNPEHGEEDVQVERAIAASTGRQTLNGKISPGELARGEDVEDVASTELEGGNHDGLPIPTKRRRGRPPRDPSTKPRRPRKGEGRRGGWSKGMKLGPRQVIDASPEFSRLHAEAVECLIAHPSDPQKALELITQAIAINPEQHRAHPVLAEAHHKLGNDQAAIDILFVGAHANPRDTEAWQDVAQRCLEWTGIGRQAALEKALIACGELINIDPNDFQARFQRAAIYREQGKAPRCMNQLEKVLKAFPRNSSAMEEYAKACIDITDVPKAIDRYKEAIEYYLEIGLDDPDDTFDWSDVGMYADLVARNGKHTETIPMAIKALKTLSRWLQGRQVETYWEKESLKDDTEFDMADEPRRILVPEYMPARRLPEEYGLGLPIEIRAQLGILRLRHGNRQEALDHFEWLIEPLHEGGQDYIHHFADLFLQVAKALADTKEHGEALRFYEAVQEGEAINTHEFWTGIGHSLYVCNQKGQALVCFQKALVCDSESVEAKTWIGKLLIEKGNKHEAIHYLTEAVEIGEARINHKPDTRVYEKREPRLLREEAERTLKHAHSLIDQKVKRIYNKRKRSDVEPLGDDANLSDGTLGTKGTTANNDPNEPEAPKAKRRDNRGPRPLKIQLIPDEDEEVRHERVLQYYTTMLNNTDAMRSGDSLARGIWIDCAKALIDDFRSTKEFFPKDRNKSLDAELIEAINRLQDKPVKKPRDLRTPSQTPASEPDVNSTTLPSTYRSIPFTAWLNIFLEYALLLSRPSDHSSLNTTPNPSNKRPCYDTIHTALSCIVFSTSPNSLFQIQICHLICALAFRDQKTLFNKVLRWFMREHAFCTDAYRLFGAMNLYFPYFNPAAHGDKESVMQRGVWRSANSAKALRRHIYAVDKSLIDEYEDELEGSVPGFMREERHETFTAFETQSSTDPVTGVQSMKKVVLRAEEMDVVLLVLYGQILYATGSFVSALNYFYRARAIDPDNALVLLSISLSYMHQMLRKGEATGGNRHMMVLQGWVMFGEYEDRRIAWAERKEEAGQKGVVEEVKREIVFNKARCWDMLGLTGLAGREYEKLLVRESECIDPMLADVAGQDETGGRDEQWTMEAAYAMRNMYMTGGDVESARMVVEKYLVVE